MHVRKVTICTSFKNLAIMEECATGKMEFSTSIFPSYLKLGLHDTRHHEPVNWFIIIDIRLRRYITPLWRKTSMAVYSV